MAGGLIKRRELVFGRASAVSAAEHRGFEPLNHTAFADLMFRQDSLVETSCRVVAQITMAGESVFQAADGIGHPEDPYEANLVPLRDWYVGARARGRLTPGCFLACVVTYIPAGGAGEEINPSGTALRSTDVHAEGLVRVEATFTKGENETTTTIDAPMEISLERSDHTLDVGSSFQLDHGVATDAWAALKTVRIPEIIPDGAVSNGVLVDYSEGCDYEVTLSYFGGARIVDLVVFERPYGHAQEHDTAEEQSIHCYANNTSKLYGQQTSGPQTDARDVGSEEEHRFGTLRLTSVSTRQLESCGPAIIHWTPFSGSAASAFVPAAGMDDESSEWTNLNQDIMALPSSSTQTGVLSSATEWSLSTPGWRCEGVHARPSAYNGGTFHRTRAYIPVRIWVYGSVSAGTASIRLKSGLHSVVSATLSSSTPGWVTGTGWLECQADAGDASRAYVVPFYRASGGITSLGSICVNYGW